MIEQKIQAKERNKESQQINKSGSRLSSSH